MPSTLVALLIASLETRSVDGTSAFVGTPRTGGGTSSTPLRPPRRTSPARPLQRQRRPPSRAASGATRLRSSTGSGFGNRSSAARKKATPPPPELFELQELRAQLQTILKQNVLYQTLSAEKREELTRYVEAVVEKAESPIDFSGRGGNAFGIAQFAAGVEGRSWRMVFSTDGGGGDGDDGRAGGLPYGSTVVLRIGEFVGSNGTMDYVLKFGKRVMGLNELVAQSTCAIDVSSMSALLGVLCSFRGMCACCRNVHLNTFCYDAFSHAA